MIEPRSFAVHGDGIAEILSVEDHVRLMGISAAVSAAYDIMTDDGFPPEEAGRFALAAERQGRDPEAFARHFVKLRKAARSASP